MKKIFLCFCLLALPMAVRAGTYAQFTLPVGTIDVELFEQDKPVTVSNFVKYVESGRWTNMIIHRWVPGFVIQGGGFGIAGRGTTNEDFAPVPTFGKITNEYSVGRTLSNVFGTLAMARVGGDTNSATSQWFFNLNNNTNLDKVDGGFTVFGKVIGSVSVLNRFNNASPTNGIFRVRLDSPFEELPILKTNATYNDLVYVDIKLLKVGIKKVALRKEISFNSFKDKIHKVEWSSTIPAQWNLLQTVTGTGQNMVVTDNTIVTNRIYRVRIE